MVNILQQKKLCQSKIGNPEEKEAKWVYEGV